MKPLVIAAYVVGLVLSFLLPWAAYKHWTNEFDVLEAIGAVTGAWGVWIAVKQNIWNWPIGIVSDVYYVIFFYRSRLYLNAGLQVVFVVLGFAGWYLWLFGGKRHTKLTVTRTSRKAAVVLTAVALLFTAILTRAMGAVGDSAPFLDALTTGMSLSAQYMINMKNFENWHVWLVTDAIYVGMFVTTRHPVSAVLYFVYSAMCISGMRDWKRSMDIKAVGPVPVSAESAGS